MPSPTQAESAAKAAALVKSTAEVTAMALNIQYIQRDLTEIKQTLKEMGENYVRIVDFNEHEKEHDKAHSDHEERIRTIEQSMWKWMGVASLGGVVISTIIAYVLKVLV